MTSALPKLSVLNWLGILGLDIVVIAFLWQILPRPNCRWILGTPYGSRLFGWPEPFFLNRDHGGFLLQLLLAGYNVDDFLQVKRCVDAMDDLVGKHHRDVRLFSEHAIGTGSCAAFAGLSPIAVCVGILHPLYYMNWHSRERPDLGPIARKPGVCAARKFVASRVGEEVEAALWSFQTMYATGPSPKSVQNWIYGLKKGVFSDLDKQIIGMSLCDEAEDSINAQQWWSGHEKNRTREVLKGFVTVARLLGNKYLQDILESGSAWINTAFPFKHNPKQLDGDALPPRYKAVFEDMKQYSQNKKKDAPLHVQSDLVKAFLLEQTETPTEEFVDKWNHYHNISSTYCAGLL